MHTRLATNILKHSYWQRLYTLSFLLAVLFIAYISGLSVYLLIALSFVSVAIYCIGNLTTNQPLHMTEADTHDKSSYWQLLYSGRETEVLWEADLVDSQRFSHCLQLQFQTVYPKISQKTVVIWQDQVDAESWRKLNVIVSWL